MNGGEEGFIPGLGSDAGAAGGGGGTFPGFGGPPPQVGPANVTGVAPTASHSDHTHRGVTTLNGQAGAQTLESVGGTVAVTTPDGTHVNVEATVPISLAGIATGATQLSTLASAPFNEGAFAWVASVGAYFELRQSALTVDGITVVAATGKAGFQWLRTNWLNPVWQAQTVWAVNTATGSDEAAGGVGTPLLTVSECARRLAYATVSATTVTVTGNMAGTDKPNWSFICKTFFGFTLNFVATVLYTGSITTAVNVSPAPTTTENNLTDTAIPVSFTASGLLAKGVIFKRTNSTAAIWYAMLDKGAKTIRISQPHIGFFGADVAITNGDTYTASQMPTVQQMTFAETSRLSIVINGAFFVSGYQLQEQSVYVENCWFDNATIAPAIYENCAFTNSRNTMAGAAATGTGQGEISSGMVRATAPGTNVTFQIVGCANATFLNRVSFQGALLLVTVSSTLQGQADVVFYDIVGVSAYPLTASYWSVILWTVGAFGGSNNSNLANADRLSMISHVASPFWIAGSSTNVLTPIIASPGPGITVAVETAGGAVVNTQQNGVFPTS